MIETAEEFVRLRLSSNPLEQSRATHESANDDVWCDVITKYPDFKIWLVRNKMVPLTILRILATDPDPKVRREVAGKRKLDASLFAALATDPDESVRFAIMNNGKCPAHIRGTLIEKP
jgi:hypothetical protein